MMITAVQMENMVIALTLVLTDMANTLLPLL